MKNVTVALPEELALWLRVHAAKQDRSVSAWLAELIDQLKRQEDNIESALEMVFSVEPRHLEWENDRMPSRGELHDRPSLR